MDIRVYVLVHRYRVVMTKSIDAPIFHVDMDAFYVEVERLNRPDLRDRPVLVGGSGPRAVVAAASYEARRFGVASAMSIAEAKQRCPQAVLVSPNRPEYDKMSQQVFDVLVGFTPRVETVSVDEAFLDVSGLRLHYADATAIAIAIRAEIRGQLSLPASVGGSTTKFLAKLASKEAKPDGVFIVDSGSELDFLHPLPVRKLWGVGEATLAGLQELGIVTVGDLAATPVSVLQARLGRSLGAHLSRLSHIRGDRSVRMTEKIKSISTEETYPVDLHNRAEIDDALFELCHRLWTRLGDAGFDSRTLVLKLRFDDFTTVTRSATAAKPIDSMSELWSTSQKLFDRVDRLKRGVRLLGLSGSGLVSCSDPHQLTFEESTRSGVERVARKIRERYGVDAVMPARIAPRLERRYKTKRGL